MNIQSIVITNCIGMVLSLLVLNSSRMARRGRDLESMLLTLMLVTLCSCCLMDTISFLADGQPTFLARITVWVSNLWLYFANPGFSVLWVLYVDYYLHKRKKRLLTVYCPMLILLGVCWTAIIVNLFVPFLFTVNADNTYTRMPAAYVLFILPVALILYSVVVVARYRKTHRGLTFFPIWTFVAPCLVGVVLQTLIYGLSLAWCSTAIGIAALYMSLQNRLAYHDALTGIYNRHYLDNILRQWSGRGGIMIDIDNFKAINDRLGHSRGDLALKDTANFLRESAPENSVPIRFAGDEFILLMETDREEELREAEERIRAAAAEFNRKSGRSYQLHLSMGHAVYNEHSSDRFLEAMDRAMYADKEERRASGELEERRRSGRESAALGEAAEKEERIFRAIRYDPLTGLSNLAWFFSRCEVEKVRLFNEDKYVALLYIDLDGMKYYNHRFGFAQGDELLKQLAELLARIFRKEDCCHIGADRFAVAAETDGLEEKLRRLIAEFDSRESRLPLRIGIYSTELGDVPVSSAYDRSKLACDAIRTGSASTWNYYTPEMTEADRRRQYIQSHLDQAIAEKWIRVYYQPIIRSVNGRVCSEEALARWIDPENGFLSPAEFIPYLEAAGQIYKLDLYVLEQVLEKLRTQEKDGLSNVPHSINLSRSDFDSCDIVEEIRRRVDAAGVDRRLITVEITESVIGSDFEYMKNRIGRFRELGFPVWMDDFGSGYSALDVLQSIRFDLVKFDMSFMRRLDEGDSGKIILTELMRMAAELNLDTVCEGVETEEQARFLQEIGCSRLQGFLFCRPIPYEEIVDRYKDGRQIGFENPDAACYFETVGRINLYDLDVIANREEEMFRHAFNTLPIGIIEIMGDRSRFVRSNPSYREFIRQYFGIDIVAENQTFAKYSADFTKNVVAKCSEPGSRTFYNERMPDGTVVHSFARCIATNPVSGETAIVVAVLSIA